MSKAEDKIAEILRLNNIKFIREYTAPDLTHNTNPLRFDFAIVENYGAPATTFIEYDSEIHFQQITRFHKNKSIFRQAQERDRVKNKWCLMHNYKLIRIPYWALETLTFTKIFNTKEWVVKNKFHNDYINPN